MHAVTQKLAAAFIRNPPRSLQQYAQQLHTTTLQRPGKARESAIGPSYKIPQYPLHYTSSVAKPAANARESGSRALKLCKRSSLSLCYAHARRAHVAQIARRRPTHAATRKEKRKSAGASVLFFLRCVMPRLCCHSSSSKSRVKRNAAIVARTTR